MPDAKGGKPSESAFIKTVFSFFSSVLKVIAGDLLLSFAWGGLVLVFVILPLMISFGNISGDQRFWLALIVILAVVFIFTLTALRWQSPESLSKSSSTLASRRELIKQVKKCLDLLTEIKAANARIIDRGHTVGRSMGKDPDRYL